jgi:hypothetical protein
VNDEPDHDQKPTSQTAIIVFAVVILVVMAALAVWFIVIPVLAGGQP